MAEARLSGHSGGSGFDHENGLSTICIYPPALLSDIAGKEPAVVVGLF